MSDLQWYLELASQRPDQFLNPPGSLVTILLDPEQIAEVEIQMERRLLAGGATLEQAHEWSRVGVAYQDQYLFLLRDAVRFGDGSLGTYIRMVDLDDGAPGVIILPLYEGQVVLVRHFRHATRGWSWEIPRGFGETGYSDEENARREISEEIGGEVSRLVPLGMAQPDAAMSTESNAMFLAEVSSFGTPDAAEGISNIRLVPMHQFEQEIANAEIVDGFTLCAYAKAKARGLI